VRNARFLPVAMLAVVFCAGGGTVLAQSQQAPAGKIICWKDKNGKIVGCGDKVPPEYQDSATRELNKRGITIKQSEAALTAEQKKAQQAELERKQAEEQKQQEQRRKDRALLDTFSNAKEIDLKRNRDLQLIEGNIETLQSSLKNANDRYADARARASQYTKRKAEIPAPVQDEVDRAGAGKTKIEQQIAQKRKELEAINQRYDELKRRFVELKGGDQPAPPQSAADRRPH
jgi:chromosome segregation ATPase